MDELSSLVVLEDAPKYISTTAQFRPGQTVRAEDVNQFFNMLIAQGDYNTEWLELLASTVEDVYNKYSTQATEIEELKAELEDIKNNVIILLGLHNRGWGGELNE